jgi:Spy/CpxP family protein refolding chaperone
MTRRLRTVLTLALAGALLVPAAAGAADADRPRGRQMWEQRFQERLALTDDQTQALRQARERQGDIMRQHFRALRQAQADLRRLAILGNDEAALRVKAAEVQKLTAEGVELRLMQLRDLSQVLTPEQREKLAEMKPRGGRHFHRPAATS